MKPTRDNITVSVIVPNYNHEKYLRQRIESIISQTFQDFELILMDDCSTDNSRDILLSYKNKPHVTHVLLNEQNSGSPFKQWEKGILLAKGKFIWIAESDDYADSGFLENTVRLLEEHPEASICLTGSHLIDKHNTPINSDWCDLWEEDGTSHIFGSLDYLKTKMLYQNTVYNASMVVFRKEGCLSDIVPEYRNMRYCGDWLFWIEQIRKGEVIEIHKKLNYFRKHGENTTNKGDYEGNSIQEIAFIKNYFYKKILTRKDLKEILIDKSLFYRHVKHLPVSSQTRKRDLLKLIFKETNTGFFHYLVGKYLRLLYMRHIRKY